MLLPPIKKAWQHNVNFLQDTTATAAETLARIFLRIKDALKGFGSGAWTVRGSSDSVTAALDGGDRLTDHTKVVSNAAGAHSWIVLKQAGTGLELCLDFNGANHSLITAVLSVAAGFTGGSTTARPTASDSVDILGVADWIYGNNNQGSVVHVLQSTDGRNTVAFVMQQNLVSSIWVLGEAAKLVTGWANPYFGVIFGAGSLVSTDANLYTALWSAARIKARGPGGAMSLFISAESASGVAPLITQAGGLDEIANLPYLQPIGLFSTNATMRGRPGVIDDLWLCGSDVVAGTTFPADGTRKYAAFGSWVVPWNGTLPETAFHT